MTLLPRIFTDIKPDNVFNVLMIILCFYIFHFYYKHFTHINPLPGPISIPLIGIFRVNIDFNDQINKLNKIYGHNGIFEFYIAGRRQIVITKAEYAKKFWLHLQKIARFTGRGFQKGLTFNINFNNWKFNRQIYIQSIEKISNSNETIKLLIELFEELSNYWIDINQNNYNSGIIDLTAWTKRFLNDLMFSLSTGKRSFAINYYYRKLKNEKITKNIMDSEHYIECLTYFLLIFELHLFQKFLRRLPLIRYHVDKFIDICNFLFERLLEVVRERREEIEKISNSNNFDMKQLKDNLLTSFIIANTPYESHPQKSVDSSLVKALNNDEISSILFDILSGSTDSVTSAFSFVLYDIAHHPDVKKKLVDEINSVFRDDLSRQITLDDLEKLKYCEAIILETLRIRSPTTNIARYNKEPDEVVGYKWPSNTSFVLHVRGINNNPLYWEDPDKFMPERFFKPQKTDKLYGFLSTSFGAGLRNCPGRKIAIIEIKLLLALIYRRFDIELVDMKAPLEIFPTVMAICKKLEARIIPNNQFKF
ncbi:cytochrome P450 [Gigaspora rosea]|uniref:Cytochrome P450 n=1 Tax=Gigaspora rosea TaxID=44941 RepID=A0A397UFK9_9GLOM|nr:cytochrome P450 [Gigaspora rosea]